MRLLPFCFSLLITVLLVFILNRPIGTKIPMPLGSFLSPQTGFWQNAEDTAQNYDLNIQQSDLKGNAKVYFDERLVPHVFAENDEDLYFIQGTFTLSSAFFKWTCKLRPQKGGRVK
ncbi:penicillin acylase family protein [Niabella sp. W65]|nr:penicillin acylase family protein [Niabella sp. W65]MCH7364276.1 penicillin acylase family protein [Niabella sp. W65]